MSDTTTTKLCRCNECGLPVNGKSSFRPGHDQIAIQRVIRDCYGTVEDFLDYHEGH